MNLPIPCFKSVGKCYYTYDEKADAGMVRFIAPDPMSGRKGRYTVVELDLDSGRAICIGRELPKKLAKRIAKIGLQEYYRRMSIER